MNGEIIYISSDSKYEEDYEQEMQDLVDVYSLDEKQYNYVDNGDNKFINHHGETNLT